MTKWLLASDNGFGNLNANYNIKKYSLKTIFCNYFNLLPETNRA